VDVLESGWLTSVEDDHNAKYSRQWPTVTQVVLICRRCQYCLAPRATDAMPVTDPRDGVAGRSRVAIRLGARAFAPCAGLAASERKRAVSARASSAIAGCATKASSMSEQVMKPARSNRAIN
jgi:hypothetical protein